MNKKKMSSRTLRFCLLVLFCLGALAGTASAKPVDEYEAYQIARLYLLAEINAWHESGEINTEQWQQALSQTGVIQTRYLTASGTLVDVLKPGDKALAYLFDYAPGGFIVVSADDLVNPVWLFTVQGAFAWSDFVRHMLQRDVSMLLKAQKLLAEGADDVTHEGWTRVRLLVQAQQWAAADSVSFKTPLKRGTGVRGERIQLATGEWDQGPHWNDVVDEHWLPSQPDVTCDATGDFPDACDTGGYCDAATMNINDFDIATGCVATAAAITMQYHKWPMTTAQTVSHNETVGIFQKDPASGECNHYCNLTNDAQIPAGFAFDWANMVPKDPQTPAQIQAVGELAYAAGIAMDLDYEEFDRHCHDPEKTKKKHGGTWGVFEVGTFQDVFRYRGCSTISDIYKMADPSDDLDEAREAIRTSLWADLPVPTKDDNHVVVLDGWNPDTEQFRFNSGWGIPSIWAELLTLPWSDDSPDNPPEQDVDPITGGGNNTADPYILSWTVTEVDGWDTVITGSVSHSTDDASDSWNLAGCGCPTSCGFGNPDRVYEFTLPNNSKSLNIPPADPDSVTHLAATNQLLFVINGLLGAGDASGTRIRVELDATGATQEETTRWTDVGAGFVNAVVTSALGQGAAPSTTTSDYTVYYLDDTQEVWRLAFKVTSSSASAPVLYFTSNFPNPPRRCAEGELNDDGDYEAVMDFRRTTSSTPGENTYYLWVDVWGDYTLEYTFRPSDEPLATHVNCQPDNYVYVDPGDVDGSGDKGTVDDPFNSEGQKGIDAALSGGSHTVGDILDDYDSARLLIRTGTYDNDDFTFGNSITVGAGKSMEISAWEGEVQIGGLTLATSGTLIVKDKGELTIKN